jgi:hypothetical protein
LLCDGADGGDVGAHPEGTGGFANVGGYKYIGTLSNSEGHYVGFVRFLEGR